MTCENSKDRGCHLLSLTRSRQRADSGPACLDTIRREIKTATLNKHVPTHVTADLNNGAIFSGKQQLVVHGS